MEKIAFFAGFVILLPVNVRENRKFDVLEVEFYRRAVP